MIKNLKTNKIYWLLVAGLALAAALSGVFNQAIYRDVVDSAWLPGTIAQDIISIVAGLGLLFLSLRTEDRDTKKQIVAMSLLAYFFYAYGIYVIEQLYNAFYLLYMAIFSLSFWSLVYGLLNIDPDLLRHAKLPQWLKYLSAACLVFIALLFYALWSAQLLPLMRVGEKIEFGYSIFILDMAFVLPALIITAILIIKRNALGLLCAPILFFKAFTLLFSVGVGGFLKPLYHQIADVGETAFYMILATVFLILALLDLWKISFPGYKKS